MEAKYLEYKFEDSLDRIDEILNSSDSDYQDKDSIPSRDKLTYKNGFYVAACALFVDIRESKKLTDKHKRPTLAKMYRSYISEIIALLKDNIRVNEIYVEGDGICGIFDTTCTYHIDFVINTAAKISSFIDALNIKLKKKGYSAINIGIGISYGNSLYIKSGFKGSGINEVVWLGKTIGEAAKLCSYGNISYGDNEIMISETIFNNLKENNKKLFSYNYIRDCYHGNLINIEMNEWVDKNRK